MSVAHRVHKWKRSGLDPFRWRVALADLTRCDTLAKLGVSQEAIDRVQAWRYASVLIASEIDEWENSRTLA